MTAHKFFVEDVDVIECW